MASLLLLWLHFVNQITQITYPISDQYQLTSTQTPTIPVRSEGFTHLVPDPLFHRSKLLLEIFFKLFQLTGVQVLCAVQTQATALVYYRLSLPGNKKKTGSFPPVLSGCPIIFHQGSVLKQLRQLNALPAVSWRRKELRTYSMRTTWNTVSK